MRQLEVAPSCTCLFSPRSQPRLRHAAAFRVAACTNGKTTDRERTRQSISDKLPFSKEAIHLRGCAKPVPSLRERVSHRSTGTHQLLVASRFMRGMPLQMCEYTGNHETCVRAIAGQLLYTDSTCCFLVPISWLTVCVHVGKCFNPPRGFHQLHRRAYWVLGRLVPAQIP